MSGCVVVRLREGRQRRLSTWTVELCHGDVVTYSHPFKDRSPARQYARRLASEHEAVVVLAGPELLPSGKVTKLAAGGGA